MSATGAELDDVAPAPSGTQPRDVRELQRRAVQGSLWTVVHVVVAVPVAFVANAVVARALGVEDYGRLAVLTLALSIAVGVTNLGFSDGVVQWGAAAHARGDEAAKRELVRRSLGFHLFVQLPPLLVFVGAVAHDEGMLVLASLLASVILPAALGSSTLLLTVENRSATSAKLAMLGNAVTQALVSATAVVSASSAAVWAARNVAGAALLPLNLVVLDRASRRVVLSPLAPRHMPVGFWRFSLFTAAGGIVGTLVFSRTEVVLLQAGGALQAAGLFALAFGLAQQITGPVDALLNPLQSAVAGVVEAHPSRAREALLRATRVSALLCAAITLLVLPVLSWLIPSIYGTAYSDAAMVFLALGVLSCLQSAVNPLVTFTRARRRAGSLFTVNCCALGVDLAVALVAIPLWGLWGAVVANTAGQLVVFLSLVRLECRAWGVPLTDFGRALALFVTAAAAAACTPVAGILGAPEGLAVVMVIVAGLLLAVLVGHLTRGRVPVADLQPALDVLPRPVGRFAALALRPFTTTR